jgi:hypothetical protein
MTTVPKINKLIKENKLEKGNISDGIHTFSELYLHRNALFLALCREICENTSYQTGQKSFVWKSTNYFDGKEVEKGWFLMGIGMEQGEQITYHLPMSFWNKTNFANVIEKPPFFDGHTPKDVLQRLFDL